MGGPVAHIVKEGARYHVVSWMALEGPKSDGAISICSEPRCELNRYAIHEVRRCGLDPAKIIPRIAAAFSYPLPSEDMGIQGNQ